MPRLHTMYCTLQYIKQVIVKSLTNDKPLENQYGKRKFYFSEKQNSSKIFTMKVLAVVIS